MLFASPEAIFEAFPGNPSQRLERLAKVRAEFESPEEINQEQPPSKRILQIVGNYDKAFFGSLIALAIGLENIRASCPHFNAWLTQIEQVAAQ